ncbi:GNAT family N-acetyltransferase [Paenibacillus agricola]|uniref:GNAT family N-acetyltransferase n=1 Tax=Paenibacillus agricola TaxID=2716264 RepID=A0ABX0JDN6_9BACL|nr:GNAT family N-acetyltransferase [Paenibacillus agricola]NHN31815.1 GNAT family N-acetyltransferase [Paenibacillus agricola]
MPYQKNLFSAFPFIQTERLSLRQITADDSEDLYNFYRDPNFFQYLDWEGPSSVKESTLLIDSWNQYFEGKKLIPWGISSLKDSRLIGTIMLMPTRGTFEDVPRYPLTISYDLQKDLWNNGIMTEALKAVLDFSKENIGHHRIQAEVLSENAASLKILKKLGFQEEGLLKHYLMHEVTKSFLNVVMLASVTI